MKTLKTNAEGYGYKYTDLAEVHKYLEGINTSYFQYIEAIDGNDYIVTVPIVDGKELAPKRGCRVVQASLSGKSNPAQEQGAALTYARRYSLLMAFGLATEDDDAETLTKKSEAYVYQNANSINPSPTTAPHSGIQNGGVDLASDAQIYAIKKLGGTVTKGLTKIGASKIISELKQ